MNVSTEKHGSGKIAAKTRTPMEEKIQYIKKHWQLYVFFLLPGLAVTIIFKYIPMGGGFSLPLKILM